MCIASIEEKIVAVAIDEYAAFSAWTEKQPRPRARSYLMIVCRCQVKLRGENFELEMKKKVEIPVIGLSLLHTLPDFVPLSCEDPMDLNHFEVCLRIQCQLIPDWRTL